MLNSHVRIPAVSFSTARFRRFVGQAWLWFAVTFPLVGTACNDLSKLAGTQTTPSGVSDPSIYHNAAGAMALYQAALITAQGGSHSAGLSLSPFADAASHSGRMSDELQAVDLGCTDMTCGITPDDSEDARQLPEGVTSNTDGLYGNLQKIRATANEAIGFLAAYDPAAPPALRGHLYALQGYAELYLADMFCSGVPLSTLDFNADYIYHSGSTTAQIYQDAVAKFDTALTLSGDSARILNFARVGKGRAWLALGGYDSAAAAVAQVPDGYAYQVVVNWLPTPGSSVSGAEFLGTVADGKGGNGLSYVASNDPRTTSVISYTNHFGQNILVANKYGGATGGMSPFTVADWIEARLIRAEAALAAGDVNGWLAQLNFLRQRVIIPGQPTPLTPLQDPGTPEARVDTLFAERAAWLFLTGHRQGDMRRLIRQYDQPVNHVFPFGPYPTALMGSYSNTILTAPVPAAESANPLFHGCFSRGA